MKMYVNLIIRYSILLIIALPNLFIFYFIFTPLTVKPVLFLLSLFYTIDSAVGNIISFNGNSIYLIDACIAGAAYYLLFILNLSTPMKLNKRTYSLLFISAAFLLLNIIRIFVFSVLFTNGFSYFDFAHKVTWYLGSTIFIVLIWFINVKIFKIKGIPVYTDLSYLYKSSKIKSK
ncbi:pacearchaeosortase [Candidatus Pacearchaeota archaeon]|nr:pacearchaeosortase [Candidatus Pacearchaeota archaeon]